jgi:hypothetical protein
VNILLNLNKMNQIVFRNSAMGTCNLQAVSTCIFLEIDIYILFPWPLLPAQESCVATSVQPSLLSQNPFQRVTQSLNYVVRLSILQYRRWLWIWRRLCPSCQYEMLYLSCHGTGGTLLSSSSLQSVYAMSIMHRVHALIAPQMVSLQITAHS